MFDQITKARRVASLIVVSVLAVRAEGQCPANAPVKIQGSDLSSFDYFGSALDMDTTPLGTMLISGSTWRSTPGVGRTGAVSVHVRSGNTWTETALLHPADLVPLDNFGIDVAFDDPYLVVGANEVTGTGDNSGAVYFFERSGSSWINRGRSTPTLATAGAHMGSAVDVTAANGGWAVVGAPQRYNGTVVEAGAAFIYQRLANGSWVGHTTIIDDLSNDGGHWQKLGSSVAIAGNVCVVGAPEGDAEYDQASISGFVKVYRYQSGVWSQSGPARWAPPICCGFFGRSVDTDGTYIAVGAIRASSNASQTPMTGPDDSAGCAFIYKWNDATLAWDLDGTLFAQTTDLTYDTGSSVRLAGGKVFVSNTQNDRVYQFRRVSAGNWVQEAAYTSAGLADVTTIFAASFAVAGSTIAISDTYYSVPEQTCGAVFAMDLVTPSGNDACNGAKAVAAGTYTGCTTNATVDGGSSCGQAVYTPGPDMWYSYTPSCTQNVIIDTIGSSYDTILSVHASCPELADNHEIVCNDDAGGSFGTVSLVSVNVTAGVRYLIRVAGYNGGKGDFTLRINEYQAAPANNSCSSPVTVTSGGTYTAISCAATTDGPTGGTCGPTMGKDLWYRFTPPANGTLTLDTCGSTFDTMLAVYPGATCPGTIIGELACNDDAAAGPCPGLRSYLSVGLTAGIPCMIRVGGWNSASGDVTLHVGFAAACACDWNHSGQLSVQDIFDFLAGYFSGAGDFNQSGATTVQDIFDFLACYFSGC